MSENSVTFAESILEGHKQGLLKNESSYILGLGVDYDNGADGTTSGLARQYERRLFDVPVSEASFTSMAVGMAAAGLNPIVHHGRIEFAMLAMDAILTQAPKWNFMFGGDYKVPLGVRVNLGRQWGNGPQHTACYSSLFPNTPGLDVFWSSRPSEAFWFTRALHSLDTPTISMEHRYLFKTVEKMPEAAIDEHRPPSFAMYEEKSPIIILTYGDGVQEALKVKEAIGEGVGVIALVGLYGDRQLPDRVYEAIDRADQILFLDTSNYQYGILEGLAGKLAMQVNLSNKARVFAPPFEPCATAPELVSEFYPRWRDITSFLSDRFGTPNNHPSASFDELHLPTEFDFTRHTAVYI